MDSGATWTAIDVRTPLDGWLGASDGRLYHLTIQGYVPVPSPATAEITDLSTTSDTDAWATTTAGEVLRWDGASWRVATRLGGGLSSVSALSPTEAWVVGEAGVWRWDGATWTATSGVQSTPAYVAAVSPSRAWLATRGGTPPLCGTHLYQWDGATWRKPDYDWSPLLCVMDMAAIGPERVALSGTVGSDRDGAIGKKSIWDGAQ